MKKSALTGIRVVALALCLAGVSLPARAQVGSFQFTPPESTLAVGGSYTVKWTDLCAGDVADCLPVVTWYYASRPDGSDRKRMVSLFREDFSAGYARHWRPDGLTLLGWQVEKDRRSDRSYLRGDRDAGRMISNDPTRKDVVLSALVRPRGIGNNSRFGVSLRVQSNNNSYDIVGAGNRVRIVQGGLTLRECAVFQLQPQKWFWLEVSLRTRKQREVELRLRVFDEDRQNVLGGIEPFENRPSVRGLLDTGHVALWGNADFAEVYVDPWEARWVDDLRNEFRWDTSTVPDGEYYLVAELADGKSPRRLEVSKYAVQVRNRTDASAN